MSNSPNIYEELEALKLSLSELKNQLTDEKSQTDVDIKALQDRVMQLEHNGGAPSALELRYKVTLPVNRDGGFTGSALEIPYSEAKSLQSPYYTVPPAGPVEFYCPAGGATTDNAGYPRSEERLYLADPHAPARPDGFDTMINMRRGVHLWDFDIEYNITEINPKGKVVILQSHAVESPPDFKVVVDGSGVVRVLCKLTDTSAKDDLIIDLSEKKTRLAKQGEPFSLNGTFDGNLLLISLNDGPVHKADFSAKKTDWYPKIGCYNAAPYPVRLTVRKKRNSVELA